MKKFAILTLSILLLMSTFNSADALIRENIPATYIENRLLAFRHINMNKKYNPMKIIYRTSLTDENGEHFEIVYSKANGNLRFGRRNRKALFTTPIVSENTWVEIYISGGVVPENEPMHFTQLLINDITQTVQPNDPGLTIPPIFADNSNEPIVGPQGEPGEPGPEGPRGPQGVPGADGKDGNGLHTGTSVQINGQSGFDASGVNYLTVLDSDPGSVEIISTITGGTRGQILFLEMPNKVRFQVSEAGTPDSINWDANIVGTVSPNVHYTLLELVHNGTNWFVVGRNDPSI